MKKSTILCFVASAGVILNGVMTAWATTKVEKLKQDPEYKVLPTSKKVLRLIPYYIPSTVTSVGTITCIFGANSLNRKQQASLISAYAITEQTFRKYKDKVIERYGKQAHNDIMDEIIKEECRDVDISTQGFMSIDTLDPDSDVLEVTRTFFDRWSKRYFESTLSKVIEAEYHLNRNYTMRGAATPNELYEFLGLDPTDNGDLVSWSMEDGICWVDFNHRLISLNDDMEVIVIEMVFDPMLYDEDEPYAQSTSPYMKGGEPDVY